MIPKISSALASQTISRRAIADLLIYLGRTAWMQNYNTHQLTIEVWAVGIWVKEAGIISYQDLASWIQEIAQLKASVLQVKPKGNRLFLVQGSQQPWYAVRKIGRHYQCECLLWRCRHKRLRKEFPLLFTALDRQIFCHHTVAASQHSAVK
ncbi:MAG: hypothetical protein AB4038_11575 [Prochloraceae cyanobacterium]